MCGRVVGCAHQKNSNTLLRRLNLEPFTDFAAWTIIERLVSRRMRGGVALAGKDVRPPLRSLERACAWHAQGALDVRWPSKA